MGFIRWLSNRTTTIVLEVGRGEVWTTSNCLRHANQFETPEEAGNILSQDLSHLLHHFALMVEFHPVHLVANTSSAPMFIYKLEKLLQSPLPLLFLQEYGNLVLFSRLRFCGGRNQGLSVVLLLKII